MNWQPIKTAPKDGTPLLLTNGRLFAGGAREHRVGLDWKFRGHDADPRRGETFVDRIPNPDVGKVIEWWGIFGCSAWSRDVEVADYDGPIPFDPTHWMPLPAPPEAP